MKKMTFKLGELSVQSFITNDNKIEHKTIKGGDRQVAVTRICLVVPHVSDDCYSTIAGAVSDKQTSVLGC